MEPASFIDSATIGVLVAASKCLRPVRGAIALVCRDRLTTRILEISGIDPAFAVCDSRPAAVSRLRRLAIADREPATTDAGRAIAEDDCSPEAHASRGEAAWQTTRRQIAERNAAARRRAQVQRNAHERRIASSRRDDD